MFEANIHFIIMVLIFFLTTFNMIYLNDFDNFSVQYRIFKVF